MEADDLQQESVGDKILLTADQTLMSDYHRNEFIVGVSVYVVLEFCHALSLSLAYTDLESKLVFLIDL